MPFPPRLYTPRCSIYCDSVQLVVSSKVLFHANAIRTSFPWCAHYLLYFVLLLVFCGLPIFYFFVPHQSQGPSVAIRLPQNSFVVILTAKGCVSHHVMRLWSLLLEGTQPGTHRWGKA